MHEVLGVLQRDVRRQWRHIRIGIGFEDDRPIGGQRLVPGGTDPVRVVDEDALEPDQFCIFVIGKSGMLWVDSVLPAPSWIRSSHVT